MLGLLSHILACTRSFAACIPEFHVSECVREFQTEWFAFSLVMLVTIDSLICVYQAFLERELIGD